MDKVSAKGIGGQITLTGKRVIIKRQGLLAKAGHGYKGDKEIPLKNITAVQFKVPGSVTNGYIQFSILGGVEAKGGAFDAASDENSVMFTKKQEGAFFEVKKYIDAYIDEEPIAISELNLEHVEENLQEVSISDVSEKSKMMASLLSFFLGVLGVDRFYLGNTVQGIGKLLTMGGFGIWALIDFIVIVTGNAKDGQGLRVKK